jgi:hypothetical protein
VGEAGGAEDVAAGEDHGGFVVVEVVGQAGDGEGPGAEGAVRFWGRVVAVGVDEVELDVRPEGDFKRRGTYMYHGWRRAGRGLEVHVYALSIVAGLGWVVVV